MRACLWTKEFEEVIAEDFHVSGGAYWDREYEITGAARRPSSRRIDRPDVRHRDTKRSPWVILHKVERGYPNL